jgi:hypothetical protein
MPTSLQLEPPAPADVAPAAAAADDVAPATVAPVAAAPVAVAPVAVAPVAFPAARRRHALLPAVSREDAASRVSAYVYGNVLVLAALIALRPDDLDGGRALLYVLGAGASTLVAHVVGETASLRITTGHRLTRREIAEEVRNALPVATSALVPTAVLWAGWTGLVDHTTALVLALTLVALRLALLGSGVARISGERSSGRLIGAGLGLAVVGAVAAVLKWQLTH